MMRFLLLACACVPPGQIQPIPNTDMFVVGEPTPSLTASIHRAMPPLREVWDPNCVNTSLRGTVIGIEPTPTFESWGIQVAGTSEIWPYPQMHLGSDLRALAHELAHLAEWGCDRTFNREHVGWGERGIYAAVEEYERDP